MLSIPAWFRWGTWVLSVLPVPGEDIRTVSLKSMWMGLGGSVAVVVPSGCWNKVA